MGDGDLMPKQLSKQRDIDMRRLEIEGTGSGTTCPFSLLQRYR